MRAIFHLLRNTWLALWTCAFLVVVCLPTIAWGQAAARLFVMGPVREMDVKFPPENADGLFAGSVVWSHNEPIPQSGSEFPPQIRIRISDIHVVEAGEFVVEVADRSGNVVDSFDFAALSDRKEIWSRIVYGSLISVRVRGRDASRLLSFRLSAVSFEFEPIVRKSIVGDNDLEHVALYSGQFQNLMSEVAPSIAKVSYVDSGGQPACSGFLVGVDLLMTNQHCVSRAEICSNLLATFGYEKLANGGIQRGDDYRCAAFLGADAKLDAAVVRLVKAPGDDDSRRRGLRFASMQAATGQQLILVQHPSGQPKQVSVEGCVVAETFPAGETIGAGFQHGCDSSDGSSGSPVFNTSGNVIGLHKAGHGADPNSGLLNTAMQVPAIVEWLQRVSTAGAKTQKSAASLADSRSAIPAPVETTPAPGHPGEGYWSDERLKAAKPLPLPTVPEKEAIDQKNGAVRERVPPVSSPGSVGTGIPSADGQ